MVILFCRVGSTSGIRSQSSLTIGDTEFSSAVRRLISAKCENRRKDDRRPWRRSARTRASRRNHATRPFARCTRRVLTSPKKDARSHVTPTSLQAICACQSVAPAPPTQLSPRHAGSSSRAPNPRTGNCSPAASGCTPQAETQILSGADIRPGILVSAPVRPGLRVIARAVARHECCPAGSSKADAAHMGCCIRSPFWAMARWRYRQLRSPHGAGGTSLLTVRTVWL